MSGEVIFRRYLIRNVNSVVKFISECVSLELIDASIADKVVGMLLMDNENYSEEITKTITKISQSYKKGVQL